MLSAFDEQSREEAGGPGKQLLVAFGYRMTESAFHVDYILISAQENHCPDTKN